MNFEALKADFQLIEGWLDKGLLILSEVRAIATAVLQKHTDGAQSPVVPDVINELNKTAAEAPTTEEAEA